MYLRFLKYNVWRFVLCAAMSFCLCQMAVRAFYIPDRQAGNMAGTLLIAVAVTAVLTLLTYNKRTVLICILLWIALAVITFIWLQVHGQIALAFTDTEDNPYTYYFICIGISLLVYVLTITRRGVFIQLVLGILLCAAVHYLYHEEHYIYLLGFLTACFVYWIVKNYQKSILDSSHKKTSFAGAFLVAAVCACIVIAVSGGVYFGIVRPLEPPVRKLTLFQVEKSLTLIDITGLASASGGSKGQSAQENKEDGEENADRNPAEDGGASDSADLKADDSNFNLDNARTQINKALEDTPIPAELITYHLPHLPWWARLLILAAVIFAAVLLKLYSRSFWLKRMEKQSKEDQIMRMYLLYLRKLRLLKIRKNKEETPYEFAEREEARLAAFDAAGTGFGQLTDIFVRICYGGQSASDDVYGQYVIYYKLFYKRARNYLGWFRHILYFFIL